MKNKLLHGVILILIMALFPLAHVAADGPDLELEIVSFPDLAFEGDRIPVEVTLSNVGDAIAPDVILRTSKLDKKSLGDIQSGIEIQETLYLQDYNSGNNRIDIFATYAGMESERKTIKFEVRDPRESITLRIIDAPQLIYDGTIFVADLEVKNLRQDAISGARILNQGEVVYYVGALEPNETLPVTLRLKNYNIGTNNLALVADYEKGSAPSVPLGFEVVPADSAVRVYLSALSSSIYLSENMEISLVVSAPEDAGISHLELKSPTEGVQPAGYYLGEQVAEQEEPQTIEVGSLLTGSNTNEEEEESRVVKGRELTFTVTKPNVGNQTVIFELNYRLGSSVVQEEFSVNTLVLDPPSIKLIQAERVIAKEGEDAIVTLHVANNLPVQAESVTVVPVGEFETLPSEFFIGEMSSGDFLPANFKVPTDNFQDGDAVSFKVQYRVERQNYETPPIQTTITIEKQSRSYVGLIVILTIVVIIVILAIWLLRRRRRWTQ